MPQIESTYKSLDTEEFIDIILYRPWGYAIALLAKRWGISPNQITIFCMYVGIVAGHLFYYRNLAAELTAIFLIMFTQALDGADGQLARMTKNYSPIGRILDGFTGNTIFVSIYIHLIFRALASGDSGWVLLMAVAAGTSHSLQSAMADFYRNGYLKFALSPEKGELEPASEIKKRYSQLSWRKDFTTKFLMRLYLNYTVEQETVSPDFVKLRNTIYQDYNGRIPAELSAEYRQLSKPLIKYYNILTTNTRLTVLFIAVLVDNVYLYFLFDLTVLNLILIYVVYKQESISKTILLRLLKPSESGLSYSRMNN